MTDLVYPAQGDWDPPPESGAPLARSFPYQRLRRQSLPDAMADVLVQHTAATGACTEDQLRTHGFTTGEIARALDAARAKARRRCPTLQEA